MYRYISVFRRDSTLHHDFLIVVVEILVQQFLHVPYDLLVYNENNKNVPMKTDAIQMDLLTSAVSSTLSSLIDSFITVLLHTWSVQRNFDLTG